MINLTNYGEELADVFIGAYFTALKRGIRDFNMVIQVAHGVTLAYAMAHKPEKPIRIQLDPAPKQAEPPKQNEEKYPKKPKGKENSKDE